MFPYIAPGTFSQGAGNQPIRGISWPVKRTPLWNNIRHKTTNGASLRIPLYANNPLWQFEFTSEVVLNTSNNPYYSSQAYTDLQILTAFWYEMKGSAGEFIFAPPNNVITGQALSNPDLGNNTEIVVTVGGVPTLPNAPNTFTAITESVQELNGATPQIFQNGILINPVNYTLNPPNSVSPYEGYVVHFGFTPTPPITANFTYYYHCIFSEDNLEFEDFMFNLTSLKSIKIEQIRVIQS